jgi:hypothetical protein
MSELLYSAPVETVAEKVTIIEQLTNDAVAIIMTVAILLMVGFGIAIPEFLILAFGMVIVYYFKK